MIDWREIEVGALILYAGYLFRSMFKALAILHATLEDIQELLKYISIHTRETSEKLDAIVKNLTD